MKHYLFGIALLVPLSGAVDAAAVSYDIQRIGLVDDSYESIDYEYSYVLNLNEQGQVAGHTERRVYDGSGNSWGLGQDAWLYDSGTTTQIGYTGAGYERTDGYRYSAAWDLNDQGQVVGESYRYSGSDDDLGNDAWVYDSGTLTQIGLTGAGHESTDGYRYSSVWELNEQGQVAGASDRYNGSGDYLGTDAWLYDSGTTTQIGYTGAGYETTDGYAESWSWALNEQAQVVGYSSRYSGTDQYLGSDAWLYDGGAMTQLGFTGTGYETSDGLRRSEATDINDQGQVVGWSLRYSGTDQYIGADAWLSDGSNTMQIGLTGAGYERSDGWRYSYGGFINNQGQVAGGSYRYSGTQELGRDAWLYDGTTTKLIGLTGAGYEDIDGARYNDVVALNDLGQAIGRSARLGETDLPFGLGQDAWFYDSELDQTFSLSLYVDPLTDYAYSEAYYLGDDGVALGSSRVFDEITGQFQQHAFYFSVDEGLIDLGLLVDDLTDEGWLYLYDAVSANGVGNIVGNGLLADGSFGAYLLTPTAAVPIPAAVWLFASGLGLLGWMRRRQSA